MPSRNHLGMQVDAVEPRARAELLKDGTRLGKQQRGLVWPALLVDQLGVLEQRDREVEAKRELPESLLRGGELALIPRELSPKTVGVRLEQRRALSWPELI